MADPTYTMLASANLAACQAIAPHAPDPWRPEDLAYAMVDARYHCFVVLMQGQVAGFACFRLVAETTDLEQVVIAPAHRRAGMAQGLLAHALQHMAAQGATRCLLEVRVGNLPAVTLYQKLGFRILARRPGMYHNPAEDGFLMARELPLHPDNQ